jgi:hypothetical protein
MPTELVSLFTHLDSASSAQVDSVLTGLQQLAISTTNEATGVAMVTLLASASSRDKSHALPSIPDRLGEIYAGAATRGARWTALHRLPFQWDQVTASSILAEVAESSAAAQGYAGSARDAVVLLLELGSVGQTALVRLCRRGLVRDPEARRELLEVMGNAC